MILSIITVNLNNRVGLVHIVFFVVVCGGASEFPEQVTTEVATEVATEVTTEVTTEVVSEVSHLLSVINGEMDRTSLQTSLGLKSEKNFRQLYLRPALEAGLIEMTIPDKPTSSKQKYRLTRKGRKLLGKMTGKA